MKSKVLDSWIGRRVYLHGLGYAACYNPVLVEYGGRWVVVRDEDGTEKWLALPATAEISLAEGH